MKELYREVLRILESGERAALATVIGSTGSTPGKESAKMLIRADGSSLGSIGGGCTEADVWALARKVIETEQPMRQSFTLTPKRAEEEGLACGGIVEIFIEPIGSPMVYLFGAGHIARSVVKIASMAGLNTTVIDDRERFANRESFPDASDVQVLPFEEAFRKLRFTASSYIVIVTRGHRHDQFVLSEAIKTPASYIGLIGSKAKISRIFRNIVRESGDAERLRAVKAPIGLNIGCRSPEEIAVSIVAQLIQHRRRAFVKSEGAEAGEGEEQAGSCEIAALDDREAAYPDLRIRLPDARAPLGAALEGSGDPD
jgi:xanthine dehydrogenase accessory factor